jgi:hypothetical protein
MSENVEKVSERLTQLEVTVAQGFHDAEMRDLALSSKIDVISESMRDEIRTVANAVASLSHEMRRTIDAVRKEHAADRKVLTVTLQQHARRLNELEPR